MWLIECLFSTLSSSCELLVIASSETYKVSFGHAVINLITIPCILHLQYTSNLRVNVHACYRLYHRSGVVLCGDRISKFLSKLFDIWSQLKSGSHSRIVFILYSCDSVLARTLLSSSWMAMLCVQIESPHRTSYGRCVGKSIYKQKFSSSLKCSVMPTEILLSFTSHNRTCAIYLH